ncbi:MAG: glycosyltransferase [Saprospiraceae bacterium]
MNTYLQQRTLFAPLIQAKPSLNLGMVVVIPAYDEPYLLFSLMALSRCALPLCDVEVIVVINDSEKDSPDTKASNQEIYLQALDWMAKHSKPRLRFHLLYYPDLPAKSAGVGLARKIGMDEACWRLMKIGNPQGIIACFDADSRCEANYLQQLVAHFDKHPQSLACSIYFEHPIHGIDFPDEVYEAIIPYELHLRYYIHAQRMTGFPFAFHTVGSSMAVRCLAYQQQGGMNKRKAGEDFYFIHKFTPLGNFSECLSTKIIPSPRPSHRVPFGTGKAVQEILQQKGVYYSYNLQSFFDLKSLFEGTEAIFDCSEDELVQLVASLPESLRQFLPAQDFFAKCLEIKRNTASRKAFRLRFYKWFNAFMVMKFVHFARDHFYPNQPIGEVAASLLQATQGGTFDSQDLSSLLKQYRKLDQQSTYGQ